MFLVKLDIKEDADNLQAARKRRIIILAVSVVTILCLGSLVAYFWSGEETKAPIDHISQHLASSKDDPVPVKSVVKSVQLTDGLLNVASGYGLNKVHVIIAVASLVLVLVAIMISTLVLRKTENDSENELGFDEGDGVADLDIVEEEPAGLVKPHFIGIAVVVLLVILLVVFKVTRSQNDKDKTKPEERNAHAKHETVRLLGRLKALGFNRSRGCYDFLYKPYKEFIESKGVDYVGIPPKDAPYAYIGFKGPEYYDRVEHMKIPEVPTNEDIEKFEHLLTVIRACMETLAKVHPTGSGKNCAKMSYDEIIDLCKSISMY